MLHRAAWLRDQGQRYSVEAAKAKLYATELDIKAADFAIAYTCHLGYIGGDYASGRGMLEVERFLRDARGLTIAEGTSDIQKFVVNKPMVAAK